MPNWIQNKLHVAGKPEDVKEFFEAIKSKNSDARIDFNNIIPAPHNEGMQWAIKNWGTKWNACETPDERDTEDTIYFQTAWAGVPALIWTIGEKFPKLNLTYIYADEDIGYNVGTFTFHGLYQTQTKIINTSLSAYRLAFYLWPDCKQFYELVDGNYRYKEE